MHDMCMLRECVIAHIIQITDVSVLAIVKHCQHVTILNACCFPLLTDVSITAVLQQCANIVTLYALDCPKFTTACLAPLEEWSAAKCSMPRGIAVSYTNFSAHDIAYFETKFPFVSIS